MKIRGPKSHSSATNIIKPRKPGKRDAAKIQMINNCLVRDQVIQALRLSRQIEDPALRFKTQMETMVDPFLYGDNAGVAGELLCFDCPAFAKSLPRAEGVRLLAVIAYKLHKINGSTDELTAQINATLLQAAVIFTEEYQDLTDKNINELVVVISREWGNFTLTKYHDRLVRLLKIQP
ncbi:hypothetical protein A3K48_03970 [candidate division WOR-1 bacterium RIFOXYA12_FULL_52_29]|uniref:Uncharacterized protein n=1 Tax=candidate division WOR-1 bacterium RIFOXYC12_FULL_54_18 TaxID=1802584 RepID=A0A1F4T6E0_UNCSA|nr:MAG: hypothetical protein A3K44_03970 [candidate division WOR-1 bacterium RIFOXYA2_FULL_51_19]OGC17713.1 MAG: hypothetical protein A3K48_03970 [candidate division WOR-1 bacterium RIFOXYA12_FULL_52_29]OGC26570.1 MAG: hypothetical protein A3K32_03965 [candidate division WOR-1 bacterium RIFOXYB2_FULL_45_9]OGC28130.1 MAG: hypothetical protein A3K49_03970 [candidate division WOR-1 bacterium RIFOXYC12_FULL_54_18]OGC29584.1 MAG: hypothetical protein A2346_02365 [candidate division WOR-1 bacterium R